MDEEAQGTQAAERPAVKKAKPEVRSVGEVEADKKAREGGGAGDAACLGSAEGPPCVKTAEAEHVRVADSSGAGAVHQPSEDEEGDEANAPELEEQAGSDCGESCTPPVLRAGALVRIVAKRNAAKMNGHAAEVVLVLSQVTVCLMKSGPLAGEEKRIKHESLRPVQKEEVAGPDHGPDGAAVEQPDGNATEGPQEDQADQGGSTDEAHLLEKFGVLDMM